MDEAGHETWHDLNYSHNQSRVGYADDASKDKITFELNELICKTTGAWTTDWIRAKGLNCYTDKVVMI